jgi:hypothetical protein
MHFVRRHLPPPYVIFLWTTRIHRLKDPRIFWFVLPLNLIGATPPPPLIRIFLNFLPCSLIGASNFDRCNAWQKSRPTKILRAGGPARQIFLDDFLSCIALPIPPPKVKFCLRPCGWLWPIRLRFNYSLEQLCYCVASFGSMPTTCGRSYRWNDFYCYVPDIVSQLVTQTLNVNLTFSN